MLTNPRSRGWGGGWHEIFISEQPQTDRAPNVGAPKYWVGKLVRMNCGLGADTRKSRG